ncbi:MAG: cupredoxin domain-containing protein [Solirubrobacterales bacterium]
MSSDEQPRPERGFPLLISTLALMIAMAALLAVCFKLGSSSAAGPRAAAATPSRAAGASTGAAEDVKLTIKSDEQHARKGPEGSWHDAYLPADFSVKAGSTVHVTVANYDEAEHSFTSPELGTETMIAAGSAGKPATTTFVFKAPSKPGRYLWFCTMPCDSWAMSHAGFMRGYVTVT